MNPARLGNRGRGEVIGVGNEVVPGSIDDPGTQGNRGSCAVQVVGIDNHVDGNTPGGQRNQLHNVIGRQGVGKGDTAANGLDLAGLRGGDGGPISGRQLTQRGLEISHDFIPFI